ncbi:hypothetical protein C6P08_06255 [Weissella confusa]|uniref:hypothetical protein n=1 Tax=Weissella confusa TaxID=1583 RepID=UPI00109245E7|nr:hypothetical protein [Weissella confusa]MBJ7694403.1 hypothetical protein [Weissella confusa]QBZ04802.1 hypothetical protein C6P08_06255 [Weissella confusa]
MFGKKVNVKQLESLIDAALAVEKNPEVALELQKLANQLRTSAKIRETEKNGYLAITKLANASGFRISTELFTLVEQLSLDVYGSVHQFNVF